MKILILANNDVGLYQFRKELIKELLKNNQVTISLPYGEMVDPLMEMGCRFIDTSVDRRGVNPIKDLSLLKSYNRILKQEQPDLVITYTIKPNIYGGMISRLRNISYAVNITGLGTAFQKQGFLRKFVTILYKTGLKHVKVAFFENEENKEIFINEHIVEDKRCCLLNGAGVNLEHYTLLEYPKEDMPIRFLFIGRMMREKGIEELFEAMKRLYHEGNACELDILGGYEEDFANQIKECEQAGWLHYHGYQKEVRPFIKQAHCFVLPSWHEGMANTNLECAASGRPVITSNIHGCKEAVIEGVSGFLCQRRDPDSLYQEMKKFIQLSNEEKRAMGIAGRAHMKEIFDKKKVVEETIKRLFA